MKKAIKRAVCMLCALVFAFGMTGCKTAPVETPEEPDLKGIPRYFAPIVTVTKDGLASWRGMTNEAPTNFEYKINDGQEVATTETSVQLELYDKIVVRCVGDNEHYVTSRWSEVAQYVPPHSFVKDNMGQDFYTVNIYKPDGTVVLDSIGGTKTYGDELEEGQDYIFEFDMSVGPYHNGLMIAGVENSVISDLTWSDSQYTARDSETADKTDKFYEVLYDTKCNLHGDLPWTHRVYWDWNTGAWGESTYTWWMKDHPIANTNGVYNFVDKNDWEVEPNLCATTYGAHYISAGKGTKEQLGKGYRFCRFKINYTKFNVLSAGKVSAGEYFDTLAGKENFNMYAVTHQSDSYIYFSSKYEKEYTARDYSFTTDENGDAADGVNIYDADSGELVLGAMTDKTAVGTTLQTDKKYIIELEVQGEKEGSVIFTGMPNSLISDVTWSDKTYANRSGENALPDTLRRLDGIGTNHHLSEEPLFHRIWKSGNGYTGNYGAQCKTESTGEVDTSRGENRDIAPGSANTQVCLEFALSQWFATTKTNKQVDGRKYLRITVIYREFKTIDCGGVVMDKNHPNYARLAGTYFNTFFYSPNGGRYLYLTEFTPS